MKNWKKGIALVVAAGLLTIAGAATALAASKTKLDTVTELYWGRWHHRKLGEGG